MRRFKVTYDWVLFALLMVALFVPILQEQTGLFATKPLMGVFVPTPKPTLSYETYRDNSYQVTAENYVSEHFGLREPVIRLYNQYLYDVFKKSTNHTIVAGKDHWIYFSHNVDDYYGTEMFHWYKTKEEAQNAFDKEARLMWKLRGVLKDYGIDFLVFMAPDKGFVYPEHLPRRDFDTSSINAREYYASKFDNYHFPYIDATRWFIEMKAADTLPFPLFPPTGLHWNFSSVYATDSLLRFMGHLKGRELPSLKIGPLHESNEKTAWGDRDLERMANLMHPLPYKEYTPYDADISIIANENTLRPNVLFVGTSFIERMYFFTPFDELFSYSEYWCYNSSARYGKNFEKSAPVYERNLLQTLIDCDYVVWETPGEQMYNASLSFVEAALMSLCLSEDVLNYKIYELMNEHHLSYTAAYKIVLKDPEYYYPDLAGDRIPTSRNPKITEALTVKAIKKDPQWMVALKCQSALQQLPFDKIISLEAQNVLNGGPLMRDDTKAVTKEAYVESLVHDMADDLRQKPDMVTFIQEKADKNGRTFEEQLEADARWIINDQIERGVLVLEGIE